MNSPEIELFTREEIELLQAISIDVPELEQVIEELEVFRYES